MPDSPASTYPVVVQVEYHPGSAEARQVADRIYSSLNDDPAIPGLKIPTFFTCESVNDKPPKTQIISEGDKVLVVVLSDDYLSAACKYSEEGQDSWREYIYGLYSMCQKNPNHRFLPIQLSNYGSRIDPRLDDLNYYPAYVHGEVESKAKVVAQRIILLLLRLLRTKSVDNNDPVNTIFLSHAKYDMDNDPYVVKQLLTYLTASHPEKFWFDSGDIESGSVFAREIEKGVTDSALIAVLTDSYSSRSWCRREIILAKLNQRPVVIVNALVNGEVRSFPYVGNVPTIRWRGIAEEVINLINRETLRFEYASSMLKKHSQSGDTIFPICPELITLHAIESAGTVLYPDPPLGSEELSILSKSGITINTPIQRFIIDKDISAKELILALSSSEATDIRRYGLSIKHQENTLIELSRYLLFAGIRLAYGGHLGSEGYTLRLADMIQDPLMTELRDQGVLMKGDRPELINYLPWPIPALIADDARLGRLVALRRCSRPEGISEETDTLFVERPAEWIPVDTLERSVAWSRGLSEMRKIQTGDISARLLIGGKIGSVESPYNGLMPGIFEEFWYSLQAKQPIFLVGVFGGATRVLIDIIEGNIRAESTWDYHKELPFINELHHYYEEKGLNACSFKELNDTTTGKGYSILNNGLTDLENVRLAHTRSSTEMISLIIQGLSKVYAS